MSEIMVAVFSDPELQNYMKIFETESSKVSFISATHLRHSFTRTTLNYK